MKVIDLVSLDSVVMILTGFVEKEGFNGYFRFEIFFLGFFFKETSSFWL